MLDPHTAAKYVFLFSLYRVGVFPFSVCHHFNMHPSVCVTPLCGETSRGLLLLPPLLLSKKPGFSRFVVAAVSRYAGRFDLRFNVVRIL